MYQILPYLELRCFRKITVILLKYSFINFERRIALIIIVFIINGSTYHKDIKRFIFSLNIDFSGYTLLH